MGKIILSMPLLAIVLSSCGVQETFNALEANRQAVERSNYVICQNIAAIEESSRAIDENRREIEEINKALKAANAAN